MRLGTSLLALALASAGCSSLLPRDLPEESPPLADLEEPLDLFAEPADEAAREGLPAGGFTGVEVDGTATSLDPASAVPGLLVKRVIENSPADAAGVKEEDLLVAVLGDDGSEEELLWPSQWRRVELDAVPGQKLRVILDRAGRETEVTIPVIARVRPAGRREVERFKETDRVGVVLRTATEVEARRADLGPGGGAVVVGLSAGSPWRAAGLRYGDLVRSVDEKPVDHPQVVLDGIREGEDSVGLSILRGGETVEIEGPLSRRGRDLHRLAIPVLFDYESERDEMELSVLLGLLRHRTTAAAWDWRFLWLFHFSGGDADRLIEVEPR